MKTKLFIAFLGIFISNTTTYSQNIKKMLNTEELIKLETSDTLIKYIEKPSITLLEGFTGDMLVKRINHKYKSTQIGKWVRKDSKYGPNAIMNYDPVGKLLDYIEFNKNNSIGFDCKYWYETKNGNYYRLENMIIYYEDGTLILKGHRYWKVKRDNFGFYKINRKRKFGKWEYFDNSQNLIKTKDYGEIK
jgi:hypothetical protein